MTDVDDHAAKAAAILCEGEPLGPAMQAAEKVLQEGAWILWHANRRDLAVATLLQRAGLLRDVDEEKRREEAEAGMQRLTKRDLAAYRALSVRLGNLTDEIVRALRGGSDAIQLADQVEAARQRAMQEYERAHRGPAREST